MSRHPRSIELTALVVGALALATAPVLPLIAQRGRDDCGWSCYAPVASGSRLVSATDLLHLRPELAVVALAIAAACVAAGLLGRGPVVLWLAALAVVATVAVLVADAARVDGVTRLLQRGT
ncbi:MAG TPA: hypothetical protein VI318_14980 [Baekduia sp.]